MEIDREEKTKRKEKNYYYKMALFNKFFQSSKRKSSSNGESTKQQQFSQSRIPNESIFPFSGEQVRVLLFRECDWTGRRLLFDSSAVQKVCIPTNNPSATSNNQNGKLPTANDKDRPNSSRTFIEICNGYGYTYDQTSCESSNIGEMVFGSVAMSFKGTSLKVHWLPTPTRILCSQVFLSPIYPKSSFCRGTSSNDVKGTESSTNCDANANQSTDNSANSFSLSLSLCMTDKVSELNDPKQTASSTTPLDVPSSLDRSSYAFSGCDSGYSGTDVWTAMSSPSCEFQSDRNSVLSMFSTDPSIVSSRKLSVDSAILVDAAMNGRSSDGCLQRRILRNMSTSFENNLSRNDFIGYFGESQENRSSASIPSSMVRRHSEHIESRSNPEMVRRRKNGGKESLKPPSIHFSSYTPRAKASQRRSKIGLAVCIRFSESAEEEMQLFCSEHIALLESMLCRLRAAAETAYLNQKRFHQLMLHAWFATTSWITDLFTAPRIQEPVWFSLSNGYSERPHNLAKHFMTELCWLLNSADTKDTNFFISTLLTAVLTNHLGWVATVAPIINSSANNDQVIKMHQNQAKMSEISKFHPYNVLWAQLGDLYGSIGNPSRLAKTIICGAHSVTINKVLNVLTYFVRCGEIQRVKSTKVLDKTEIEAIISDRDQRNSMTVLSNIAISVETQDNRGKSLSRSRTCLKEISTVCHESPSFPEFQSNATPFLRQPIGYDSHVIDTNCMQNTQSNQCLTTNSTIKLMVTSPNNDRFEYETASEAIDFILKKVKPIATDVKNTQENRQLIVNSKENHVENKARRSLWSIDTVTDGISIDKWQPFGIDGADSAHTKNSDLRRSHSLKTKSNTMGNLRRSKTFREIKVNEIERIKQDRAFYNPPDFQIDAQKSIEPLESLGSLQISLNRPNQRTDNAQTLKPSGSVVFVLGDNEVLSGLKTPSPSPILSKENNQKNASESKTTAQTAPHTQSEQTNQTTNGKGHPNVETATAGSTVAVVAPTSAIDSATNEETASAVPPTNANPKIKITKQEKKKKHCTHKKHSGVKFNFEQYPQIVTNYMKNKNLDITSYDFLEKGLKLEQENAFNNGATSTSLLPMFAPEDVQEQDEQEEEEECECCANTFRILQTPSNATELEFSNDDEVYPVPALQTPSNATELEFSNDDEVYPVPVTNLAPKKLDTVIENDITTNACDSYPDSGRSSQIENEPIETNVSTTTTVTKNEKKNAKSDSKDENGDNSRASSHSIGKPECFDITTLPIPKTQIIQDNKSRYRIRPGYVPSLFVGITDHFIPDMVLQGITSPLHTWEPILKQNLTLASHCATFEQIPTENVAIIANCDKWDVKLVTSQSYALSSNGLSGPIGMSQLVSTMLETVHAMWLAGSSAHQCMSFLESKLKEIYLQSETLAAFLLATEFCSLNTVTTALNLSANDVPLLLSVASIHSPQVTKKYGISFR